MEKLATTSEFCADDPTDWPVSFEGIRRLDSLLRCSICYEYFNIAVMVTTCSHNYCSLCIRKHLTYQMQCPSCSCGMSDSDLKCNRVLDELVNAFQSVRVRLLSAVKQSLEETHTMTVKNVVEGSRRKPISSIAETNIDGSNVNSSQDSSDFTCSQKPKRKRKRSNDSDNKNGCFIKCENTHRISSEGLISDSIDINISDSDSTDATGAIDSSSTTNATGAIDSTNTNDATDTTEATGTGKVMCPVCARHVASTTINSHLDACLLKKERPQRSGKRQTDSGNNSNNENKLQGRIKKEESNPNECIPERFIGRTVPPVNKQSEFSKSPHQRTGSNELIPAKPRKRQQLPKLLYNTMSDKQLRNRLKGHKLSTKGDRKTLMKRLQQYTLLYNSQCDAINPMSVEQIIREVNRMEMQSSAKARKTTLIHTFDRTKTEQEKQKFNEDYLKTHRSHFDDLIKNVRSRISRKSGDHEKDSLQSSPKHSTPCKEKYFKDTGTPFPEKTSSGLYGTESLKQLASLPSHATEMMSMPYNCDGMESNADTSTGEGVSGIRNSPRPMAIDVESNDSDDFVSAPNTSSSRKQNAARIPLRSSSSTRTTTRRSKINESRKGVSRASRQLNMKGDKGQKPNSRLTIGSFFSKSVSYAETNLKVKDEEDEFELTLDSANGLETSLSPGICFGEDQGHSTVIPQSPPVHGTGSQEVTVYADVITRDVIVPSPPSHTSLELFDSD